jgi:pimeloyl-ACP methyl ester carboxylesterase
MTRKKTFDQIYQDVAPERREELLQFRATHPYRHLTVGGADWAYIAAGQGAEVLLLLGGGLSVGETAFRRILELEGRVRLISPSYPPLGQMGSLTDGLAAILDAEGIERAHVFGHSLGAAVAHALVRRHPDRVDRLTLSGFGIYNERNARWGKLLFRAFELLPYGFIRAFYLPRIGRMLADADPEERAFMQAYTEELFHRLHTKTTMVGQFKLLVDLIENAGVYGVFEPVERPGRVLILAAEDDAGFTPAERQTLISLYPGAQVHLFESGGHWVGFSRREEYNAVLYGFLGLAGE